MRRRLALGWFGVPALAVLVGCGADAGRGLSSDEWATIGAYQQEVSVLQTQVGAVITAVPTPAPATPAGPLGAGWQVTIAKATRTDRLIDPASPTPVQARGVYLVLRLNVVNAGLTPVTRFPWWNLRVRDGTGRLFTPQQGATVTYAATAADLDRPEAYQPGLTYRAAVVFDVPATATGLRLQAQDGSLDLPLPAAAQANGTPEATPSAGAAAADGALAAARSPSSPRGEFV